jgi:hypothetical protein
LVFNEEEILQIIEAQSPEEVTALSIKFIKHRAKKVSLVCGPVSTGNRRTPDENWRRMAAIMSALRRQGVAVFNPFIFLKRIERMRGKPHYQDRTYVREVFHLPLLRSRWVETVYLTFEWRHSVGARWHHDRAKELGIKVIVVQPSHAQPAVK